MEAELEPVMNNECSMGSPVAEVSAEPEVHRRATAFRMRGQRVDGQRRSGAHGRWRAVAGRARASRAGGLGTIGILDPPSLREEIAAARRLTSKPIAVNLLLPFARCRHCEVAAQADVVVIFWVAPSGGSSVRGSISAARSRKRSPRRGRAPTP
jgi:hypothetical protein